MSDAFDAQKIAQADAIKAEGNELFKAGNYKHAAKKYKEALLVHPSAPLYTNRAQCYVHMNRFRDAITDCERAIELDKTWVRSYTRMADCYIKLNEASKAKYALAEGLHAVPENEEMMILLGRALQNDRVSNANTDVQAFSRFAKASRSSL
jgi:tetratricopeptide (TPR) repeat protein